jgi:alanyl-tRNA synthetase
VTERLYYTDSTLLEFDATIIESKSENARWMTLLDRSAFYPTSGGQLHDIGSLGDTEVIEVIESETGDVAHVTAQCPGKPGDTVHGRVDPIRRRRNRQCHTAQHIISGAFATLFDLRTMSVHLGLDYANVELPAKVLTADQITQAERLANDVIARNLPVEILSIHSDDLGTIPMRKIPERQGMLRIIKIGDFDYAACGGTHCSSTAEVGLIKVISVDKIRGRSAVRFLCGELAVDDYVQRFDVTDALSRKLTCHVDDILGRLAKIEDENRQLKRQVSHLQKQQLPALAAECAADATTIQGRQWVVREIAEMSLELHSPFAVQVSELTGGVAILLDQNRLVIATAPDTGLHAGNLARQLAEQAGLKGGGSERVAQLGGADRDKLGFYRDLLVKLAGNA